MLETSTRLLNLLSLLQARRHWPGAELAERLEVGPRTVRRDVERLRRLGYPVQATPGVDGGYRLAAGAALPPLLLDDEEAVAIAVGLRTAVSQGVAGIGETSVRALSKLQPLLPERVRRRVRAVDAATFAYPASGPAVDSETLLVLATACRDSERVRFNYRSHSDERSRRLVEPCGLVHTGRRWYLVAWDADRADWRTFRVDRIDSRPSPERRFVPREPPEADLAAYVARRVSAVRGSYRARIILHAPLDAVTTRVPPNVGTLEAIDDHRCLLLTSAEWLDGLAVYIANLDFDFEVSEPPELVARLKVLSARFERAAALSE
ncbi:MAG: YafY family protein [Solirubrobacteraceae bacterium]